MGLHYLTIRDQAYPVRGEWIGKRNQLVLPAGQFDAIISSPRAVPEKIELNRDFNAVGRKSIWWTTAFPKACAESLAYRRRIAAQHRDGDGRPTEKAACSIQFTGNWPDHQRE
jgi:hypothetical protein